MTEVNSLDYSMFLLRLSSYTYRLFHALQGLHNYVTVIAPDYR